MKKTYTHNDTNYAIAVSAVDGGNTSAIYIRNDGGSLERIPRGAAAVSEMIDGLELIDVDELMGWPEEALGTFGGDPMRPNYLVGIDKL